jgi:WD40 repeat protein
MDIECDPLGRFVAARHEGDFVRLWDLDGSSPPRVIQGPSEFSYHRFTADGNMLEIVRFQEDKVESWIWSLEGEEPILLRHNDLGTSNGYSGWTINSIQPQIISILNPDTKIRLWPLSVPADAEPVVMQRGEFGSTRRVRAHPSGRWFASSFSDGLTLWPLARPYRTVFARYDERAGNLVFGPEGRWLASSCVSSKGSVRVWQLEGHALPPGRVVHEEGPYAYGIAASPNGNQLLLGTHRGGVQLISTDGEAPIELPGTVRSAWGVTFSGDGRYAAASGRAEDSITRLIRVWDTGSREEVVSLDLGEVHYGGFLHFAEGGSLLSSTTAGLWRWNIETGGSETLYDAPVGRFAISADDAKMLLVHQGDTAGTMFPLGSAVVLDVATGLATPLSTHGDRISSVAMDAAGTIAVTGDADGVIRVGPVTGEEPHLLPGNPDEVYDLAIDPKGRWIASSSGTEVTIWPMPDLSKPPLHTLPREELIAKLKTLTNLRVVRDAESATGWKLEVGPFPGWETVPTW